MGGPFCWDYLGKICRRQSSSFKLTPFRKLLICSFSFLSFLSIYSTQSYSDELHSTIQEMKQGRSDETMNTSANKVSEHSLSLGSNNIPSLKHTIHSSTEPSKRPSGSPSESPSSVPSLKPSKVPSDIPTWSPSNVITLNPSEIPSDSPTVRPDPRVSNNEIQARIAEPPKNCYLRDLSMYAVTKVGDRHKTSINTNMKDANCLHFKCSKDIDQCDNILPTNYDGPELPCCVHILRDMSRVFDEAMCSLGLDYSVAFGTLLGLIRADQIIPWTIDNDYIIPSQDVANAMVALWDTKATGLAHMFQSINRMCVTPDFAGGKLQEKWSIPPPAPGTSGGGTLHARGFPYIDFYVGHRSSYSSQDMFQEINGCSHLYRDVFPTKRVLVYNHTFAQNLPANPEQLLRTYYGKAWSTPRADRNPHGGTACPYSPTY